MPVRPCIEVGCTELVDNGTRCAQHEMQNVIRRHREGGTGRRGSSAAWLRVRKRVFQCQRGRCALCGEYLVGTFEVHHIDGNPANNVPANLEALHPHCHRAKTNALRKAARAKPTHIVVNTDIGTALSGDSPAPVGRLI